MQSQSKWREYLARHYDASCASEFGKAQRAGFDGAIDDYIGTALQGFNALLPIDMYNYAKLVMQRLPTEAKAAQVTACKAPKWVPVFESTGWLSVMRARLENRVSLLPGTPAFDALKRRTSDVAAELECRRRRAAAALPPLPSEADGMIQASMQKPDREVVSTINGVELAVADLRTLHGATWLNDEVINAYYHLIMHRANSTTKGIRVHAFNSFFYPKLRDRGFEGVRRWTRSTNIFDLDLVLLPVHLGMHWCMACIDMRQRKIVYYDSLGGCNDPCLKLLADYLVQEAGEKKRRAFDTSAWTLLHATVRMDDIQLDGCRKDRHSRTATTAASFAASMRTTWRGMLRCSFRSGTFPIFGGE